jgi:HSP20 family protein
MMTTQTLENDLTSTNKTALDTTRGEPTFEGKYFGFTADILEDDEAVTVIADLPGVAPDRLDIDLRDNTLTIMGRVDDIPETWRHLHEEYEIGGYMRQFNVGPAIDQEKIAATIKDGVLKLVMGKADRLKPRKIDIRGE